MKKTKNNYNKNITRYRSFITAVTLALFMWACSDSLFNPREKHKPQPPTAKTQFGLVEITISGIGSGQLSTSARPVSSLTAAELNPIQGTDNTALSFDGTDDWIEANGIAAALETGAFTVEAWVKPESGTGSNEAVFSFHDSNHDNLNIVFYNPATDKFIYYDSDNTFINSANSFPSDSWYHVALVVNNAGEGKLYVDGQSELTFITTTFPDASGYFSIGQEYDGTSTPTNLFDGLVDEFRAWGIERSQSELQANMDQKISPVTTELAAYYHLNESSGTTAGDATTNHNDGTLHGNPGWGVQGKPQFGTPIGDGTIQLMPLSNGSFTYGERGSGGMRYLYATFGVRNAEVSGTPYSDARYNLTFLAVDTDGTGVAPETYNVTAVSKFRLFDGTELEETEAAGLAAATIPTGRVITEMNKRIMSVHPDVLQVFTETEIQLFEDSLPPGSEVADIFPYGFVVHSPGVTPGSRTLPALTGDSRPEEGQFDGVVTFAFKIPLQAQANKDPFEITMMFLPVDDGEIRITRSIQEALYGGSSAFELRAMQLAASSVTLLGNTDYNGTSPAQTLCDTRIAGTVLSPVTTLNAGAGCTPEQFTNYFVDAEASGSGNGLSWEDAFNDLQDALAAAQAGEPIWVAEGTYYPDEGAGQTASDRTSTFQLKNGVAIFGGFDPSVGDDTFNERHPQTNVTILSGDLTQNDGTDFANYGENAYHVVTGSDIDNSAVLSGFTITGGNANDGSPLSQSRGGGIYNDNGSPTLLNLIISGNKATLGGGVFNMISSPVLMNTIIKGNKATTKGGGIYNAASSPILTNVKINLNQAIDGGGIFNFSSSPELTNVVFSANLALGNGGGMNNSNNSSPVLTNVTISGNLADVGGGMYNEDGSTEIRNSIVWGNVGSSVLNDANGLPIITNSIIGGGCPPGAAGSECTNVSSSDPLFTDGDGADNTYGTADDDFTLQSGSPAIDAGNNSFLPADIFDLDKNNNTTETIPIDLGGNPRVVNGTGLSSAIVDMGAYEVQ